MSKGNKIVRLAAIAILLTSSGLYAQEHPRPPVAPTHEGGPQTPAPPAAAPTTPPVETTSKTKHSIDIHGKTLAYTATAGTLVLKKDDKPWANMFYVAYTRDDASSPAKRPITFAFNGGPGSSSVWLHMGALGPKSVDMGPEANSPSPRIDLVDNDDTALEFTRSGVHRPGHHRIQPRRPRRTRQHNSTASTAIWNRWPNSSGFI